MVAPPFRILQGWEWVGDESSGIWRARGGRSRSYARPRKRGGWGNQGLGCAAGKGGPAPGIALSQSTTSRQESSGIFGVATHHRTPRREAAKLGSQVSALLLDKILATWE